MLQPLSFLLPPKVFEAVASARWPTAWWVQVALVCSLQMWWPCVQQWLPGKGFFANHQPCPSRRSPRQGSPRMRHRILQFLVGCGESTNGGREGQVCSHELLKHGRVVGGRKRQVVECRFKPLDCRPRRRKHTVSPAERLPPPQGQHLMLALEVGKTECHLLCHP